VNDIWNISSVDFRRIIFLHKELLYARSKALILIISAN
jgi:hypothetical protein